MKMVEVLEVTANILGNISVPRYLNEQIGVPIDSAANNLRECIRAYRDSEAKAAQEQPDREMDAVKPQEELYNGNSYAE